MIVSRSHCPPWCVTHWFICHLTGIWHLADINFWTVVTGKSKSSRVFLDKHPPLVEKKPKKNCFCFCLIWKIWVSEGQLFKNECRQIELDCKGQSGWNKEGISSFKEGKSCMERVHRWGSLGGEEVEGVEGVGHWGGDKCVLLKMKQMD